MLKRRGKEGGVQEAKRRRETEQGDLEAGKRCKEDDRGAETTRENVGGVQGAETWQRGGVRGAEVWRKGSVPGAEIFRKGDVQGAEKRGTKKKKESLRGADMTPPQALLLLLHLNRKPGRRGAEILSVKKMETNRTKRRDMTPPPLPLPLRKRGSGGRGV